MVRNALRVCIQQSVRSAALLLLPLAFASLVIWATAGSGTGKTSDPLRAAVWLWLAANHIPFHGDNAGVTTWLSFLPLGSLIFIYAVIRSGYLRAAQQLQPQSARETNRILLFLALSYSVISTILAVTMSEPAITFPWYLALLISFLQTFVIAYLASELRPNHPHTQPWQIGVKFATTSFVILWGVASLITALSLAFHFSDVKDLTTVIQPGIFGGVTFLAIQILYLPNVTLAAFSYLVGAGFHLGNGSWIHPLVHRLAEIPALPILGALPTQKNYFALLAIVLPVGAGFWISQRTRQLFAGSPIEKLAIKQSLTSTLIASGTLALVLSFLGSGSLMNRSLSYVGPSWWLFPIALTAEIGVGVALSTVKSRRPI